MGESADQIREQIAERRSAAGDKIDQLQSQVENTAEQMRAQVQGTAEQLTDQAKETVDHVKDQAKAAVDETVQAIKENMDLRQQVEERPLIALGAALFGGFLLGNLLSDDGSHGHSAHPTAQSVGMSSGGGMGSGAGSTLRNSIRNAAGNAGLDELLSNTSTALLGSVTDQLKNVLDQNFPGFSDKLHASSSSTPKPTQPNPSGAGGPRPAN